MKIGNFEINGYAALAPMAGVADASYRLLAKEHGALLLVSEMIRVSTPCEINWFMTSPVPNTKGNSNTTRKNPDIFRTLLSKIARISENITISGASMSVLRAVEIKSGTKCASSVKANM